MSNIVQTEQTNLLNASLIPGSFVPTVGPLKLRLMTGTVPTATTAGTELTNAGGSTYTVGGLSLTAGLGTTSGGTLANTAAAISFTNMPSATITAIEVWDSAGTALRKWFASIAPKTTNLGDTLTFATSSINFSLTT